jgi:hypothetical protein
MSDTLSAQKLEDALMGVSSLSKTDAGARKVSESAVGRLRGEAQELLGKLVGKSPEALAKVRAKAVRAAMDATHRGASKQAVRMATVHAIDKGMAELPRRLVSGLARAGTGPAMAFAEVFFDTDIAPRVSGLFAGDTSTITEENVNFAKSLRAKENRARLQRAEQRLLTPSAPKPPEVAMLDAVQDARMEQSLAQLPPESLQRPPEPPRRQPDPAEQNMLVRREGFAQPRGAGTAADLDAIHKRVDEGKRNRMLMAGEAELKKRGEGDVTQEILRFIGSPEDVIGKQAPSELSPAAKLMWYRMGGNVD